MPKFAASLSWLFQEVPLLERFERAAASGFRAVEIQNPYGESPQALAAQLARNDLEAVLLNVAPGVAAVPGREAEFREALRHALHYAEAMGCRQLHCPAGATADPGAKATMVSNLRWAAAAARAQSVRLLIEPLNSSDNPGYFLTGSDQARRIIDAVGSAELGMQWDAYHIQIMEGSLTRSLRAQLEVIGHIQIGGVPGRGEPDDRQEINYPYLLALIDELGFEGWVGCEFAPAPGSDGLGWAAGYGLGSRRGE